MDREITTHKGGLLNDQLGIIETSGPGPGGAPWKYEIYLETDRPADYAYCELCFQNGNPAETISGISNEAVLAVLIDRLEGFQDGPFAHDNNRQALDHLTSALQLLQNRTAERTARGVEGTQTA